MLGCADTKKPASRPVSMRERQDEAIRDPFGYGPKDKPTDMPNVTGGGTGDFDKKGFKRDVDRVLNP